MRTHDEDEELPWNEEQWEDFMKRSDARSARFGELFETLIDHPDRDEIIDKEMGWDQRPDDWDEEEEAEHIAEMNRICEEALDDPDIARQMEESDRQLEAMPAYNKGMEYALKVHRKLKHLFEAEDDGEPCEDLIGLMSGSHIVSAKIAGGHGMGYTDDALCGNIVNCRRGLKGAEQALQCLEDLRQDKVISQEVYADLKADGEEVRQLVIDHVEELRKKVWWD
ncbi:MAG: hypothetical protein QF473_22095 [Planctomycetota bacterium]|jgi:hypothetical protein|nr:hypothetical protein [Planctomycetota bacterium]MDP6503016.1 hypothetical protein [Planctomycetota bacterium]